MLAKILFEDSYISNTILGATCKLSSVPCTMNAMVSQDDHFLFLLYLHARISFVGTVPNTSCASISECPGYTHWAGCYCWSRRELLFPRNTGGSGPIGGLKIEIASNKFKRQSFLPVLKIATSMNESVLNTCTQNSLVSLYLVCDM